LSSSRWAAIWLRCCGFANSQAHTHDAKDPVAFFQITGRIEIARARKIDIVDSLMIAERCWPIGWRQSI